MKKFFTLLVVFAVAGAAFGNGVSLNSPGTRAISMGGAYIAHVDDYSAPYWNPAGLMKTEGMQASFFITDLVPMAKYEYDAYAIDAEAVTNHHFAPNFSFLWTCMLKDDMRMGLSMIVPAGLGVEWEGEDFLAFNGPSILGVDPSSGDYIYNQFQDPFEWESGIGVVNFALSAAKSFGDKLDAGVALNFAYGMMTMKRGIDSYSNVTGAYGGGDTMLDTQYEEESSGIGFGLGLGVQYMLNDKIDLGFSLRTPTKIAFSGDAKFGATEMEFDRDISWPLWVGAGMAYQAMDNLKLAFDVQWSQWSETQDVLTAEYENGVEDDLTLMWEDAVQIRFGAEYWMNENLALRAGFYLDPAPGVAETQTILIPQADYNVIAGGVGYKFNEKFTFDFALEYLIGSELEVTDADKDVYDVAMPGKHNINIFVWSLAVNYMIK